MVEEKNNMKIVRLVNLEGENESVGRDRRLGDLSVGPCKTKWRASSW
jgi:hypothetical protein